MRVAVRFSEVGAKADGMGDIKFGPTSLFRVHIKATTPNIADIERIEAQAGRYFNKSEDDSRRAVCFIGADVADKLFPTSEPLGQTIRVDGRPYQVIGVGKALGSVFGQPRDMYVAVPLSTFLATYGSRRSLSVSVTSAGPQSYQDAIDEANVVMRTRRKLSPGEKDNFGIITPKAINELRDKIFGTIQIAAIGVTSISLVVGGIVIMNIMLVSVSERTKGDRDSQEHRRAAQRHRETVSGGIDDVVTLRRGDRDHDRLSAGEVGGGVDARADCVAVGGGEFCARGVSERWIGVGCLSGVARRAARSD